MPEKRRCPRCAKTGLVRVENVIKGADAMRACFCGNCGHQWQVGADDVPTSPKSPSERPDRSR